MPASLKSTRQPPDAKFADYTLHLVVDDNIGLTPIADTQMKRLPGQIGEGGRVDRRTIFNIPFDFPFDGQIYSQVHISTNGWITLDAPGEIWDLDYIDNNVIFELNPPTIDVDSWTSNHIILCPWFDYLRNTFAKLHDLDYSGHGVKYWVAISEEGFEDIKFGRRPTPVEYQPTTAGVKYYFDDSSSSKRLIIRWASIAGQASSIIKFDLVLYENGRIEYRYEPRSNLYFNNNSTDHAAVGIFGDAVNKGRYRDFSLELGAAAGRLRYSRGGTIYDPTFDAGSGIRHVFDLNTSDHWPGQLRRGAMFVFQPPQRRRKILPRASVKVRDSLLRYPTHARTGDANRWNPPKHQFDDRRTLNVTSGSQTGVINYPVKSTRYSGSDRLDTHLRTDLYEGGIEALGSTQGSFDIFQLYDETQNYAQIVPFNEDANSNSIFKSSELHFFATGSNENEIDGFSQPIWSKTQIKLEFPINYTTKLLETGSSILYYNSSIKQFLIKGQRYSFYTNGLFYAITNSDLADVDSYVDRKAVPEDYRGFGPVGNLVVSGSGNGTLDADENIAASQTSPNINALFSQQTFKDALSGQYGKSVCVNPDYDASDQETFTLPISQPFLIEKAIIELPIEAGAGWFEDQTKLFQPIGHDSMDYRPSFIDMGGPAVTVALFNQLKVGDTFDNYQWTIYRRDLILSATFTHTNDKGATVGVEERSNDVDNTQFFIKGFDAFSEPAAAYVTPDSNDNFTGSIRMLTKPQISNGIFATLRKDIINGQSAFNKSEVREFIKREFFTINESTGDGTNGVDIIIRNNWINNFGRAQSGFEPSGQSVLGGEHKSSFSAGPNGRLKNYFYNSFDVRSYSIFGFADRYFFVHPVNLLSFKDSPYLVFPGQKLVLSISKTRPVTFANNAAINFNSATTRFDGMTHDIKIPSGSSVKITLFGSLIQEAKEYHDTLNQQLGSEAIHEAISEPILDQFEVANRLSYIGTYDDAFMSGSLFTVNPKPSNESDVFIRGQRARAFSRSAATSDDEFMPGFPISINLTRQNEIAGSLRNSIHVSNDERYWDSLVPDIREIIKRNGGEVWYSNAATVLNSLILSFDVEELPKDLYDYNDFPTADNRWMKSYPFESHYNNITRIENISSVYEITPPARFNLPTAIVDGIIIGLYGIWDGTSTDRNIVDEKKDGDNKPNKPTYLSKTDTLKCIYGFGDNNNYTSDDITYKRPDMKLPIFSPNFPAGSNHQPKFTTVKNLAWIPFIYSVHPEIRGWKYGLINGIPQNSHAIFRRKRFGQFRDMLEQRPFTKYFGTRNQNEQDLNFSPELQRFIPPDQQNRSATSKFQRPGPIYVKFINPATGRLTLPENTWSSNLSFEATSSMPYIDGVATNRPEIIVNNLNQTNTLFSSDENNNITL